MGEESLKPSHLAVIDDMPNGWKVEAWYETEAQADDAANVLKEKYAELQAQFKVIDAIRVTESCALHGNNVAVFYVGAECPLCNAEARTFPAESDKKLLEDVTEFFEQYADNTDVHNGIDAARLSQPIREMIKRLTK